MNRFIPSIIFMLGIGLSSSVLASEAGTQVSPSTINLSAKGVVDIGIHTQLSPRYCDKSTFDVKVMNDGLTGGYHVFANSDLSIGLDSIGHFVINIIQSAWSQITPELTKGEATFYIYGYCTNIEDDLLAQDAALIVDNFGVKK